MPIFPTGFPFIARQFEGYLPSTALSSTVSNVVIFKITLEQFAVASRSDVTYDLEIETQEESPLVLTLISLPSSGSKLT